MMTVSGSIEGAVFEYVINVHWHRPATVRL
jgi:hypothetical protein